MRCKKINQYRSISILIDLLKFLFIHFLDAAGVVAEIGEGVTQWEKGDRVVYHGNLTKKGGYAEYAVAPAHVVSRIPDEVSFEDAAAIPTAGYTAYQALYRKLPFDQINTIFIHGGAGGVGGFAVQLAKQAGKTILSHHTFLFWIKIVY
ncbi:Zinc-type alcohol dehydrogenase-like protein [compost metagenome]